MPPKIAKKLTAAQTQRAIAQTQRVGESQDNQEDAVQPDQETQVDDATQPDQDTQVEDNTQPDADVPTSSADSNAVNDVVDSTADGADATTPDTPASSTHETETKPAIKTAAKKPAGKKVAAAAGKTVDGTKKKRRRKYDPTNFKAYIFKGLSIWHGFFCVSKADPLSPSSETGQPRGWHWQDGYADLE
ncbi:unnamed protein product [Aureobasidium mustum]|uniref:Uncharacterized protein n=1 Tax=Aureobasidium mustum TaxID=2773714 RepID=A0A9N8JWV2_9PEZI|nr:unnamed protein product [Aureobasidium mustum]